MRSRLTSIGAAPGRDGATVFRVWAPTAERVRVVVEGVGERDLEAEARGYWSLEAEDAPAGTRYAFRIDDGEARPDPASRSQPDGVHGLSEVVASDFEWTDAGFRNPSLDRHVLYELHVGTFTRAGTFDGAIERLDWLRDLGVTMVELLPVAEFPGSRNWGYDGVAPFAAQSSYGGAAGLARLVDAAHARGLAVCLDVVYNHLGPEGNYLREFGPYFTDRYATPWGEALNFDGPGSDEVRNYFIQNALYWVLDLHIDALRLDAVHAINDAGPVPFVRELTETVQEASAAVGRHVQVIAESASNDPAVIRPRAAGGHGCDAQWNDDFHHALRAVLTGERKGYFEPFGRLSQLADAYRNGYVFVGQHSSFHDRSHGAPADGVPDRSFVVFSQNHDQVGNRAFGDRLGASVDFESLKLAGAATVLSPFTPLLFMGEEFAAETPFQYFVSHGDPALVEAVRKGRRAEFEAFDWTEEPPDPQAESTFEASRLDWAQAEQERPATMVSLYKRLLELRRRLGLGSLNDRATRRIECREDLGAIVLTRETSEGNCLLALNFAKAPVTLPKPVGLESAGVLLDTSAEEWGGLATGAADGSSKDGLRIQRRSAVLVLEENA